MLSMALSRIELSSVALRAVARAKVAGAVPMLVLTPSVKTARKLGLLWGAHAVTTRDIGSFEEMIAKGKRMALRHGICKSGAKLVMMAGVPFGTPGSTNVLHVATLTGDRGMGPVIAAHPELVLRVPIAGANPDVDTPEDLRRL